MIYIILMIVVIGMLIWDEQAYKNFYKFEDPMGLDYYPFVWRKNKK